MKPKVKPYRIRASERIGDFIDMRQFAQECYIDDMTTKCVIIGPRAENMHERINNSINFTQGELGEIIDLVSNLTKGIESGLWRVRGRAQRRALTRTINAEKTYPQ